MTELRAPQHKIDATINLSGSKSISNRLLILNAVLAADFVLENLSDAEDTVLLKQALEQIKGKTEANIHVNHAGSDFRFLTALLAITPGNWTLTGSERLKQRPVKDLVEALLSIGANISYLAERGFPPLQIEGKKLEGGSIDINANISSQFITALLLVAPSFTKGLQLQLKTKAVSRPYIDLTIGLMKGLGIKIVETDNIIHVSNSKLSTCPAERSRSVNSQLVLLSEVEASTLNSELSTSHFIESDWSSASYWYSICALSKSCSLKLNMLSENSLQADSVLPELFAPLGVHTQFEGNTVILSKQAVSCSTFEFDFTNCPDIAQTLALTCFALGIEARLTGLQTLKIKETDRIEALKTELEKFGATVLTTGNSLHIEATKGKLPKPADIKVDTYHDHRMAMSFAPLALLVDTLVIRDPDVVNKSYPRFWADLKNAGFSVNLQP